MEWFVLRIAASGSGSNSPRPENLHKPIKTPPLGRTLSPQLHKMGRKTSVLGRRVSQNELSHKAIKVSSHQTTIRRNIKPFENTVDIVALICFPKAA